MVAKPPERAELQWRDDIDEDKASGNYGQNTHGK